MERVRHTRLQISRHKMRPLERRDWTGADMTGFQREKCMQRKCRLSTAVCQSGSLSGAGTLSRCQNCNPPSPCKTSTPPSGPYGRWLQIDNHQYSLWWILDLLLSSFPNYLILYRKLFINVLHLQQSLQVINYFKSLSLSNDWFSRWYTERFWFFVRFGPFVLQPHSDSSDHNDTDTESWGRKMKNINISISLSFVSLWENFIFLSAKSIQCYLFTLQVLSYKVSLTVTKLYTGCTLCGGQALYHVL